jgi:hypothetical protein
MVWLEIRQILALWSTAVRKEWYDHWSDIQPSDASIPTCRKLESRLDVGRYWWSYTMWSFLSNSARWRDSTFDEGSGWGEICLSQKRKIVFYTATSRYMSSLVIGLLSFSPFTVHWITWGSLVAPCGLWGAFWYSVATWEIYRVSTTVPQMSFYFTNMLDGNWSAEREHFAIPP